VGCALSPWLRHPAAAPAQPAKQRPARRHTDLLNDSTRSGCIDPVMSPIRPLLLLTAASLLLCQAAARADDAFEQNQRLGRGVNILGYDPIWRSRDQARFQEKHFRLLAEAGFRNVRVNLHPFRHMAAQAPHALPESWFATLDWAIAAATRQKLMVILDCHEFNAMGEDPGRHRGKFFAFWRQLSQHCRNAPEQVVFEILNEPSKQLTPSLWNQTLREALAIIRETNSKRTVIVGPAFWNSIDHLAELELPADDPNLIVTVHYYKPMEFTHQGASWSDHRDKAGIEWPANEAERQAVRADFGKASAWAKEHRRPLFLGEFGAYDRGPLESRVRYTNHVARTAEALGWSWAYWQFDSDFLLWDMRRDDWVAPILRALIPAKQQLPP
jgi:endoglucanase